MGDSEAVKDRFYPAITFDLIVLGTLKKRFIFF